MKNEVAAYVIMEAMTEPIKPKNVQVFNRDKLFYLRFEATLQEFNVPNRNKRIYMGNAMIPSLRADHIMELEKKGSWFGEAGHPHEEEMRRILTIDPKMISHKIVSHTVDNNFCKGVVETLSDGYGKQMTNFILQGMEPAFSLRALAPLTKKPDGTSIIQSRAHVVTYDWVILPSHIPAYRDQSKPIQKIIKDIQVDGNTLTECALSEVTESMIKNFISLESVNVELISSVCEVAKSSMELSDDLKNVILKENGFTYFVPLEEKIKNEISDYLINL